MDNVPQTQLHPAGDKEQKTKYFKQRTIELLGKLPMLELFPHIEAHNSKEQTTSTNNEKPAV